MNWVKLGDVAGWIGGLATVVYVLPAAVRAHPHEISVLAIGPLTNIAAATTAHPLELEPGLRIPPAKMQSRSSDVLW